MTSSFLQCDPEAWSDTAEKEDGDVPDGGGGANPSQDLIFILLG